ncbi:MAG: internalization-related competence protein ComEC/Rec2, competence protein ComEC protein [Candidatus Levybacteria bacterium GW2011_GWC1_40_19]|nr:MAG: internalization-related competence protein ComEC/Rec2, competence protein ComEC protein [Candidatus Levybacteria bacterium GW2011_GWC1_40_19]HBB76270.1 hypothetical protein [Candidatus Levybacteria bacterium]
MRKSLILIFFAFCLVSLGFRFYIYDKANLKPENGSKVAFKTRVLSEVKANSRIQSFSLSFKGYRIYVNSPLYPQISYGDMVMAEGTIGYKKLGTREIIVLDSPKIKPDSAQFSLLNPIYSTRQRLIEIFQSYLPPEEASLLLGIVFGVRESFSPQFYEELQKAGVLHVIAASGMNISMLGALLAGFFGVFLKRQMAIVMTCIGIVLFAALAGFEPSIVRASIMGLLAFSAQILGRQSWALLGAAIAGFIMLFVSPSLIKDIGFQLSFTATLGLVYIPPMIQKAIPVKKAPVIKLVGEDIITTISAQISTLPIILANFGTYSIWSVLVNSIVLWTVPLLMIIGGVTAILALLFEPFGNLLYLALPLLWYFKLVVRFFGQFGQLSISIFPWQIQIAYYSFIFAAIVWRKK